MSDYIKRDDALDMHFSVGLQDDSTQYVRYTEVKDNIKHIPTADVVEVIRCKDCKNYEHVVTAVDNEENVIKECNFCNHWKRIIDVNDYCSYGERKVEE